MKTFISKSLKKVAAFLYVTSDRISPKPLQQEAPPSLQAIRVKPWLRDNGDKTHRLNYNLNENSLVMDMGGYEGQWAADIFCKYNCTIHIFEPYPEYAKNIEERFKKNSKVTVYNYGLSKDDSTEHLYIAADSSSTFKSSSAGVKIQLKKIDDFIATHNIDTIDLIKINIEGGEYDLLEHIIANNLVKKFQNIQVQFHDFVPDAQNMMDGIKDKLGKTHYPTYQYEFVWENWKLKS